MLISYEWMKELVEISVVPGEVPRALAMIGLETFR